MEKEITSVIRYFSFFAYVPTLEEIHTFLPSTISKDRLRAIYKANKYTVGEYSKRKKISKRKLEDWRYRAYIVILTLLPQIKLVGLSGSISMMNAGLDDDIDLFIITKKNRLFTGRFLATILSYIMGLKRGLNQHKAPDRVCLNLFFDEKNMVIPRNKQSIFVGHEVLQMKPIVNKNHVYEKFLEANKWVFKLFPNSKVKTQKSKMRVKSQKYFNNFKLLTLTSKFSLLIFNSVELIFKKIQLVLINRHRTTELITNSQLWFHPDDFEKKMKF